MPDPTPEQAAAITRFTAGDDLVLQAGAGTGKTTTLRMLAASDDRRGLYIVFNRSVAEEAAQRFPARVRCATAHSLAFRAVAGPYRHRLGGARIPSRRVAAALGITLPLTLGGKVIEPWTLAYIAQQTVRSFCWSADRELAWRHVPVQRGAEDPEQHGILARTVLPFAQRVWQDVTDPAGNRVRFDHDHYLKMWQLTSPRLGADYVLVDEAQDTNPVLESVIRAQYGHAQLVLVGDSAQQIYAWRGARDIMTGAPGTQLRLSQSFRFGQTLADEANRWLAAIRSPLRLTGHHETATTIGPLPHSEAVLCRTNTGALTEVMHHLTQQRRVAMAGGGAELRAMALAARDLKAGRGTSHHELFLFKTWEELREYAENDPAGRDLAPWVRIVDDLGHDTILALLDSLGAEDTADVTVSTAHRAKGREWSTVRISDDFPQPEPDDNGQPGPISWPEARLAYVAVTRARHHLDHGSLHWIHNHPDSQTPPPGSTTA